MVATIKFSQFSNGGDLANGYTTVGFGGGNNQFFNNPWTFLPSGSTGSRPVPGATVNFRLRLNTDLQVYEYYNPITLTWTELSGSGTGTVNPGLTNDLAFYPANGTTLSPIATLSNGVLATSAGGIPSIVTTLPSGLNIPGAIITSSTAALTAGSVVAAPVAGTDLTNKTYVDTKFGSGVTSITGTTNQVITSAATGAVTLSLPQDIATGSSPTFSTIHLSSSAAHAVLIGQGAGAITNVLLGAGQLLIGTTASDPLAATLTAGANIGISSASGSITIAFSGVLPSANGGTGVNNGTSTLTLGGNLTTSGAFASTFTMTAATNVTFPTSGTLLTAATAVSSITGTANQISASASVGAVTLSLSSNPVLPGTGGMTFPTGNTAQRAGIAGTMRFNSQTSVFEATVDGATWATVETSATGVTSVSGTLNRITSTGGTTPVIDISASYVGQNSITTLGTITTGVWNGTNIALANGGTNASLTASNGGIFYSTGSAGAILSGTATANQILLSGASGAPSWSTTTYPATNAINTIMYASSANVLGSIAAANSSVLVTNASGVPAWSTTLPTLSSIQFGTGNGIHDSNGNNEMTFSTTASAVNFINIANAATGNNPSINASGTDLNVGIIVGTKGTGQVNLNSANTTQPVLINSGTSLQHSTIFAFSNTAATQTVTFPDATGTVTLGGFTQVVVQVFTGNGTYTPTAGMKYCDVYVTGSGGGGGGAQAGAAPQSAAAGGGGSGSTSIKYGITAAAVGVSQTVTVGVAGTAGTAGNNTGGTGNVSSFGAIITTTGGIGGSGGQSVSSANVPRIGGAGGAVGSGGSVNMAGGAGGMGICNGVSTLLVSGEGGTSFWGGGVVGVNTSAAGNAGLAYGTGGSGAGATATTDRAGGAGAGGVVVVVEYI